MGCLLERTPHSQRHVYYVDEWIPITFDWQLVRIVSQGPCQCCVSWLVRGHCIIYIVSPPSTRPYWPTVKYLDAKPAWNHLACNWGDLWRIYWGFIYLTPGNCSVAKLKGILMYFTEVRYNQPVVDWWLMCVDYYPRNSPWIDNSWGTWVGEPYS